MSIIAVVANLLAILSLVALALVVLLLVVHFAAGRSDEPSGLAQLDERAWLAGAGLVALIATSGSLYFSEVAHFVPCVLCWYQRIAMYPLVILLLLSAARRDLGIRPYAMTLGLVGAAISLYHVVIQRLPSLNVGSCSPDSPCTQINVEVFGFVTIPFMALSAFLLIATLLFVAGRSEGMAE